MRDGAAVGADSRTIGGDEILPPAVPQVPVNAAAATIKLAAGVRLATRLVFVTDLERFCLFAVTRTNQGGDAKLYRRDRLVWGGVLFRTTNPEVIEGAIIRRTTRLHWTKQAAMDEVLEWARRYRKSIPIRLIGKTPKNLLSLVLPVIRTTLPS